VKKEKKVREKGFLTARIPSRKKRGLRQQQVVAQKIPSIKGFPPKRPETTTSCGPENPIHQGIPTREA
jgi:hypothetical protein